MIARVDMGTIVWTLHPDTHMTQAGNISLVVSELQYHEEFQSVSFQHARPLWNQ